jgi:hypothetical protein
MKKRKKTQKTKSQKMKTKRMMLLIKLTTCWTTSSGIRTWKIWSRKRTKTVRTMTKRRKR